MLTVGGVMQWFVGQVCCITIISYYGKH